MKRAIRPQGSAAEAGYPERLWSLQFGKNRQSLQKHLGRLVLCEQGAADLNATTSAADPYGILVSQLWRRQLRLERSALNFV